MKDELLFTCACNSAEHQIIMWQDEDLVYASIHLVNLSFFERLWLGVKYILGYKCKYGNFEEFIWRKEDAEKLEMIARKLKEYQDYAV